MLCEHTFMLCAAESSLPGELKLSRKSVDKSTGFAYHNMHSGSFICNGLYIVISKENNG